MAFGFLKKMFGLKQEKTKEALGEASKSIGAEQDANVEPNETDWVKMLELVIVEYCEEVHKSRPSFPITKNTNFKKNLNFDGIDMAKVLVLFEQKCSIELPNDSPLNSRKADDIDYTVGDLIDWYGLNVKTSESGEKKLYDHVSDFAHEAAKPITNQRIGLLELLPSFKGMEKDATAEEVMRVAGIASTLLNLTFKNPFPINQDPVFGNVLKIWTESLKNLLKEGKYTIDSHEELKAAYSSKYPESTVKSMMEIDYWNQRMIEHAVITKTLGPKPAYQCLQAALNLSSFAGESSAILIVNYAHLLLKCSLLKMQNPIAINDIVSVLKKASAFLHFEEGMNYRPKGETASSDNPLLDFIKQIEAQKRNE